jgi:4-aminobutyrate aminotransferase
VGYIEDYLFTKYLPPEEVSILIGEAIQGEGGYVVPPLGYFKELKKLLDKYGILLAIDEVQSGMGRTGKWFAIENFDVVPDIITIAKGIAAGLPLGVMASRAELQDWTPGSHASTFGGNPVACAAASAVIKVIKDEGMLENAQKQGKYIMKRLEEMKESHRIVGDVRGIGLMCGIELVKDKKSKIPAPQETEDIMMACFRKGIALVNCGKSVIRLMPPLIITRELIDTSLDVLNESLNEVEKTH